MQAKQLREQAEFSLPVIADGAGDRLGCGADEADGAEKLVADCTCRNIPTQPMA